MPIPVFFTGATGYIGGSVLQRLLQHKDASRLHIRALIRSEAKIKPLEALGVEVVHGSYSDLVLLEKEASEATAVITTADSDDVSATEAILRGMKKRKEATGHTPLFIHTSGTGVLNDDAKGMYAGTRVYDDAKVEDIESLAPTQLHRPVDLAIVAADKAGDIKSFIVLPGDIYGVVSGPFVDAKIQNPLTMKLPRVIMACLDRGHAAMVGEGKNLWPNVQVDEVVDFYILLIEKLIAHEEVPHGREGYFFLASGEHNMYDVGKAIGQALVAFGVSKSAEPSTFTKEELVKYAGAEQIGTNSRCIPSRAKALGWAPTHSTKDFLASILPDAQAVIQSLQAKA